MSKQGPSRRDGALERRARARADLLGLRDPHGRRRDQGRVGAKRLLAPGIQQPFLRGPLRLAESFAVIPELRRRLPEARLPFERPSVLAADRGQRRRPSRSCAARAARRRRARAPLRRALARAGAARAPRRRARRLPRRRARLDRDLRARREAGEGARALRLAPDRPAPRRLRGRRTPRRARPAHLRGTARRRLGRRRRHRRRGLRLDDAASAPSARQGARDARPRAAAPARDRRADPEQLEVAEAALAACLELEHGDRQQTERRLPPEVFDLPVEKMREGYYTDAYFNHTRETLLRDGRHPRVVMQVFQRNQAMLGGVDEAIAILKLCSHDWDALTVHALHDGDRVEPWETVMTIEGDYTLFAHLETVYLGVLTRRTLITTNTARVVEAANGKPIIFMPARHDHHRVQTGDGYAAYVAGAMVGAPIGVTSDAQASWWGGRGGHRAARADRLLRRQHRPRRDEVRRVGERGHEHRRPRRLRERLGAHGARGRPRARPAALGRPARHVGPARRPLALGRAGRLRPARRQRAARAQGARRPRRGRLRARQDRRLGRLHRRQDRGVRAARRARSTPTGSARR